MLDILAMPNYEIKVDIEEFFSKTLVSSKSSY
jgi:hypothetical protein